MTLADFIEKNGLSLEAMADRIGDCSVSGLRKWLKGERIPGKEQMERIFAATNGEVRPDDFYDLNAAEPNEAAE